ncbi:MAG: 2-hydroxychromene-2-carboxylate isomerase, partial [Sphingomonadaceae bacterium]
MKPAIEFYFDFTSPYGFLASHKIEALAAKHGRAVNWHPVLLGAAFKVTGAAPPVGMPLKGDYLKRDFERSARFHGVSYRQPSPFPVATVAACRAYYWLAAKDAKKAVGLAKALYHAYFEQGVNISEAENVVRIAASVGCDEAEVRAALNDQAVKDRARAEVDAAIAKGVFGSPYLVVDGEPFWGVDRFDQIERWLAQGPF